MSWSLGSWIIRKQPSNARPEGLSTLVSIVFVVNSVCKFLIFAWGFLVSKGCSFHSKIRTSGQIGVIIKKMPWLTTACKLITKLKYFNFTDTIDLFWQSSWDAVSPNTVVKTNNFVLNHVDRRHFLFIYSSYGFLIPFYF